MTKHSENLYTARWNAAQLLFLELKAEALKTGAKIWYDGDIISTDQIVMNDYEIVVKVSDTRTDVQFINDPSLDEGLYTKIGVYEDSMRSKFKLVLFMDF